VRNGLPHAVQFSLHPTKDSSSAGSELLSGTHPLTQIIPAGAIGLVEVVLNCRHSREQQLKRTLTYSANGATGGGCKLTVTAVVTPVALQLSETALQLEFPLDCDEPLLRHPLTLTNHGTAPCEYSFSTKSGKVGAFRVAPETGTVPVNSGVLVDVIWAPLSCHKLSDVLVLSVVNGADTELVVEGKHDDARCSFSLPTAAATTAQQQYNNNNNVSGNASQSQQGSGTAAALTAAVNSGSSSARDRYAAVATGSSVTTGGSANCALDCGTVAVGMQQQRIVKLSNTGKGTAVFGFENTRELSDVYGITVEPANGRLEKGETVDITVTLCPLQAMRFDGIVITASIRNGKAIRLLLSGESQFPQLRFVTAGKSSVSSKQSVTTAVTAIEFGGVALGTTDTVEVTLVNSSVVPASLCLDLTDYPEFSVADSSSSSSSNSNNSMADALAVAVLQQKETSAAISTGKVGGTRKVEIKPQLTELDATLITCIEPMTITTISNTTATAAASTQQQQQQQLQNSGGSDTTAVSGSAQQLQQRKWRVTIAAGSSLSFELSYTPTKTVLGTTTNANTTGTSNATVIGGSNFRLPLSLQGLESYSNNSTSSSSSNVYGDSDNAVVTARTLQTRVTAHGVAPVLTLSAPAVVFDTKFVAREQQQYSNNSNNNSNSNNSSSNEPRASYRGQVTLRNDSSDVVCWCIDDAQIREKDTAVTPVWYVSPTVGNELGPGEETIVRVTFVPRTERSYEVQLPLYLTAAVPTTTTAAAAATNSTDSTSTTTVRPYLKLPLKGSAVHPKLSFSASSVQLPVVPLNTVSKARFAVLSSGFTDAQISYRVASHCPVALTVHFSDGKAVGIGKDLLPIEVSFASSVPTSFCTQLDIFDTADGAANAGSSSTSSGNSGQYSLMISGCADNCLLTNWSFVQQQQQCNSSEYEYYAKDGKPVQFLTLQQRKECEALEVKARTAKRTAKTKPTGNSNGNNTVKNAGTTDVATTTTAAGEATVTTNKQQLQHSTSELTLATGAFIDLMPTTAAATRSSKTDSSVIDKRGCELLAEWLSANAVSSQRIDHFPGTILESYGKLAVEAIECMSGKKLPGTCQNWLKISKLKPAAERAALLYEQYSAVLNWLRERGCLLAGVRAEALLDKHDCVRIRASGAHNKSSANASGTAKQQGSVNGDTTAGMLALLTTVYGIHCYDDWCFTHTLHGCVSVSNVTRIDKRTLMVHMMLCSYGHHGV
jgi:hypothetical protein